MTIRLPAFRVLILFCAAFLAVSCGDRTETRRYKHLYTIASSNRDFGEVYGIGEHNGELFYSDGDAGKIYKISKTGEISEVAAGLDTPSGIAFYPDGRLVVAESGKNRIVAISIKGEITPIAGSGEPGYRDGETSEAMFRAPTSVAIVGDKIYVSDTYNDAIRVIDSGYVTTLAGGNRGFSDGFGAAAKFDTPLGIALFGDGRLLVADCGNRRIRIVASTGEVETLAGNGEYGSSDSTLTSSSFTSPTDIAVSTTGTVFVADGKRIRVIGRRVFATVETIALPPENELKSVFAITETSNGDLIIADREDGTLRRLSEDPGESRPDLRTVMTADQFRELQPGRWPYDPPLNPRDIAGTLGEIRGEIDGESSNAWFHNGLDIAGSYGEIARFVRSERVLDPVAAANFGTLRELLRMPALGYVHISLGRYVDGSPFDDARFIFSRDETGKIIDVRVPRGAYFSAGEPIGTLNAMNHVHLIAGRQGNEMNALIALDLPGRKDTTPPVIERVQLFTANGEEIETARRPIRINRLERLRIVVTAYDRMDGNPERRRLGVYSLGYSITRTDGSPASDEMTTIRFDKNPPNSAIGLVYDRGSRSGATGTTTFRYIVSNFAVGEKVAESFADLSSLSPGKYFIRTFATDRDNNRTNRDLLIEITD